MAAPSQPIPLYLGGSKPGVFDPTQPARLLRYPDSTLLFVYFNPLPGSGPSLSADALTRARRIVVEVPQANDFSGRPNWFSFVPHAALAPGVVSEGKWPRVINYCGRRVVCDQDQWDIHKLDPMYDCFVPPAGMDPTISKKISVQGGPAPNPEGHMGHDCPDVPMCEATSTPSSRFAASASSAMLGSSPKSISSIPAPSACAARPIDRPLPRTASSATPSSFMRSSDQPRPRTPDIAYPAMEEGDKDLGKQSQDEEPSRSPAQLVALVAEVARSRALTVYASLEPGRRQRRQEHYQRWMPWSSRWAIDRYLAVSEQFDRARFSYENPVDLFFVPWPVLRSPFTLHVSQVDWQMVEAFFKEADLHMAAEDYRTFVEESYRRFHPDRWSSRGVFKLHDSELAQALQRACVVVSQALGPIRAASRQY